MVVGKICGACEKVALNDDPGGDSGGVDAGTSFIRRRELGAKPDSRSEIRVRSVMRRYPLAQDGDPSSRASKTFSTALAVRDNLNHITVTRSRRSCSSAFSAPTRTFAQRRGRSESIDPVRPMAESKTVSGKRGILRGALP